MIVAYASDSYGAYVRKNVPAGWAAGNARPTAGLVVTLSFEQHLISVNICARLV